MKNMKRKWIFVVSAIFAVASLLTPAGVIAQEGEGEPEILAMMHAINDELAAAGLGIAVEQIHAFTIGVGRPANRIHQNGLRWVPGDARRVAQGDDLTYIVDNTFGRTASGLRKQDTEPAIDRALDTWNADDCLGNVEIVKRPDPGGDITIFDAFFGFGGFGNFVVADIVNAGWFPRELFEAVFGPGGGRGVLAFSVSFIFVDAATGNDVNGDGYLDTALNEVYYNDTFGDRRDDRAGNPWGIDIDLPGIDVETVALHENGHSLQLGHFGPPPDAVMNPVYAGIRHSPFPIDDAGMCALWESWPNP